MARYRLRFLLQEFDLPRGPTLIGRSVDCNLTIEDPLVSRQHARMVIDETGGYVEDLGSRNGVRVNGVPIRAPTHLSDGDRVRIGTQDLVFCRVDPAEAGHSKTTGVLRLCAGCRLPYPRELLACPHCEATEQTDPETWSGSGSAGAGAEDTASWSVQLFVEALARALRLGRLNDAERIVRRATAQVDDVGPGTIDADALAQLAAQAAATTLATNDPTWALWVLDVYRRTDRVPTAGLVERLGEITSKHSGVMSGALESLLAQLLRRDPPPSQRSREVLVRLERMRSTLDEIPSGAAGVEDGTGTAGTGSS